MLFYILATSCQTITYAFTWEIRERFYVHMARGYAGHEGNKIASCSLKVISSSNTTKRLMQVWCANCAGENNNCRILMVLIYIVTKKYSVRLPPYMKLLYLKRLQSPPKRPGTPTCWRPSWMG